MADGYGIKIRVWHGQLVIEDGFGRDRRRRTFARATSKLRRLILLGHTGYVTLEAINWLNGIGAALVQIDKNGRLLLASSVVGRDHAGLRRAQARAAGTETGHEIARRLLVRKLAGQVETLEALGIQLAGDELRLLVARAEEAESLDGILAAEASAAKTYWEALAALPCRFPRAELEKIPDHWRTVGGRRSPIGGRNRKAANPANAILNYLYRVSARTGACWLRLGRCFSRGSRGTRIFKERRYGFSATSRRRSRLVPISERRRSPPTPPATHAVRSRASPERPDPRLP